MRWGAMFNPFAFVGAEIASSAQVDETLGELYGIGPHLTAVSGFGLASLAAAFSGHWIAAASASGIAVFSLLFRAIIGQRFAGRSRSSDTTPWLRLFVLGSAISGASYGLAAAILFYGTSFEARLVTAGIACAIVQGAAARAYMMPGTALMNILLVLGTMSAAAAAAGNLFVAPACLVYLLFLLSFIARMVQLRARQLRAEGTTERLLQEIIEKNALLKAANEKLAEVAFEDALTGLANRRQFDIVLGRSLEKCGRDGLPLTLMLIDVDNFKAFNDTFGHHAGDLCLQQIARTIRECNSDQASVIARYGGEEFAVVLPDCDEAMARAAAERTRIAVQMTDMSHLPGAPRRQSISIGFAASGPCSLGSYETLLKTADEALYEAKRSGRNQVCFHAADPNETEDRRAAG